MLTIVVQAGGESRRMGQDKALLPFLGKPLIKRIISRVYHLGDELIVTTNHPENYAFLNLPLYPDLIPGRGALGGLYTALSVARHPLVAVVACDMPFVGADLLAYEVEVLSSTGSDAVIPETDEGAEPFHAVYRREICLPAIERAVHAGKWRVNSWFADARLRFLTGEEIRRFDPEGLVFWNINTPEEFQHAEELAKAER